MQSITKIREILTEALRGRYELEREIGRGGMATVFLARDLQQDRPVAIKVMDPTLANAVGAERFLREIAIARSMEHQLIVPLYDSGDADGVLYYVMPYVQGESLYERLKREPRLPLGLALRITHDIASALGYAHQRGILHRDLKPENILIAEGRALVADFGLARAIGADSHQLTATGIVVGTIYYMSPEQICEDDALDQRTDVYSLGCILYEMLTGGPPYTAPSLKEVVTRILRAPVPSVRRLRSDVPETIDQAVSRALAKAATARFATMEAFAAALSPPAVGR
jgi:serine/threonine-protein kinase